jgi:5'-3' exonuclease
MHLLVDARNSLYRAIYAVRNDRRPGVKYHYFTVFLRLLRGWLNEFKPQSVHVFWDAPRTQVWRRQLHEGYKDRSDSNFCEGLSEDLAMTTAVAQEFLSVMGVRQYSQTAMEADDLIYAAVTQLHPQKTIVISSDSDMIQIPYRFATCAMYDPCVPGIVELPTCNPVQLKALVGDKSDHIEGYYGIGPKKGQALVTNPAEFQKFLEQQGSMTYKRNLALIDLSMCPRLLKNTLFVQQQLGQSVRYDKGEVNSLIMKHKVNGLLQEFKELVLPFADLA